MTSAIWLPLEAAPKQPMNPGTIPNLFQPCRQCKTPSECSHRHQCWRMANGKMHQQPKPKPAK